MGVSETRAEKEKRRNERCVWGKGMQVSEESVRLKNAVVNEFDR